MEHLFTKKGKVVGGEGLGEKNQKFGLGQDKCEMHASF